MPLGFFKILMCLLVVCTSATAHARTSSIVAVVNGELISYLELENRVKPLLSPKANTQSEEVKNIYKSTLQEIIQEEILVQEAKKAGYAIRPEMLDSEIMHRIASTNLSENAFYAELAKSGISKEAYRKQLERSMLIGQVINANVTSKIVVTDADILEYYKKYEKAFASSIDYHIGLIVYDSLEDANKNAKGVQEGSLKFEKIAENFSVGPNADNGGDMGFMKDKDMSNEILYYVQRMKEGEITSLINLGSNKAQVMLIAKKDNTDEIVIDAALKQSITEILANPKREERYNAYLAQVNKKALVDIRYE